MKTEPSSPECVCNYCGRNRPETRPEFPSTPSLDFLINLATQGLLSNDEVQILRHIIITTSDMSQLWQMAIEHIQVEGWRVIDDEWYCSFCQKKKGELYRLDVDRDELAPLIPGRWFRHQYPENKTQLDDKQENVVEECIKKASEKTFSTVLSFMSNQP